MKIYSYIIFAIVILFVGSCAVRVNVALATADVTVTPSTTATVLDDATTSQADPYYLKQISDYLVLGTNSPIEIVTSLIRIALSFLAIVFLLMILSSGTQLLFSFGNDDRIKRARQTFFQAIVGIIIIFMSLSIVTFLFDALGTATGIGNEIDV